jgi:hypothetical protein
MPQYVQPGGLLRGDCDCRAMLGGEIDKRIGDLSRLGLAGCKFAPKLFDGMAQIREAGIERIEALFESATLVFELKFLGREPLAANKVMLLLVVEGAELVTVVRAFAFEFNQRGFRVVQGRIVLSASC